MADGLAALGIVLFVIGIPLTYYAQAPGMVVLGLGGLLILGGWLVTDGRRHGGAPGLPPKRRERRP